jgi:hypothetical protein
MAGRKSETHLWEVTLLRPLDHKIFWVTTKTKRLKTLTDSIGKLISNLYRDEGMHWEFRAVEYRGTIDI